jgi:sigma-B regulation protein RsbU (phosphoserine phosphatase)
VAERLRVMFRWLGRVGVAFLILFGAYLAAGAFNRGGLRLVFGFGALITGTWLAIRLLRMAARHATWRLRNRLLVTYLFISVVPIVLVAGLAIASGYALVAQMAVYLVTSELDRRIDGVRSAAASVVRTAPADRMAVMKGMIDLFYSEHYPGIEVALRDSGKLRRYPEASSILPPPNGWEPSSGVLLRQGNYFLWSYAKTPTGDVTVTVPMTREFLDSLVPNLGLIDFGGTSIATRRSNRLPNEVAVSRLPPAMHRMDRELAWFASIPTFRWDRPGDTSTGLLTVRTRATAVLGQVFDRKADLAQTGLQIALVIGVVVFFIVEIVSLVIGVTMTRTITSAVHRLYGGTQKVIEGDFSHRIEVRGRDQLAELSRSFNTMTENLEKLLVVAKEKERLQSEIEIAREVQSQLFPRVVPQTRTLKLTAICQPARMVSGDYYDYEIIRESQVALAIGDVAGKGISAALLMATLQSSLRTQLQSWLEAAAAPAGGRSSGPVSTSRLVGRLNTQLHALTSPEKYATFCLGIYDEASGSFTYTNAGHLPPLLVCDGVPSRLDVNGTVVGAFPFSVYNESRVDMKSGDLLLCFTDGVTEPENEYGEMFGEDRLTELVARNAHRTDEQIVDLVLSSVHDWTASEELQDDMTMLLARRT